jgi:hypothetical protein
MTGDVDIYLRTDDEAAGRRLGCLPLTRLADLEALIQVLGRWGVWTTDVGVVGRDWLTGQFALDDRGAVFEVVIAPPDES